MPDTNAPGQDRPPGRHRRPPPAVPPYRRPGPAGAWPGDAAWRRAVNENVTKLETVTAAATGHRIRRPGHPADTVEWRRAVGSALAALNELVTEMTAATSASPAWTAMVYEIFRDCTWALGYRFRGERAPAGFVPPWDRPEGRS